MRKRYLFWSGLALLAILLTLVVWQVSFSFGDYGPADAGQTFVFWAVSTLIFLLTVTLGFMLFRTGVKLYLERQANREGSRIKTKLLAGALALSLLPVVFLALFSYVILNRNVEKWFSRPAEGIRADLVQSTNALSSEVQGRASALAHWIALLPEVDATPTNFAALCRDNNIASLEIRTPGSPPKIVCPLQPGTTGLFTASAPLRRGTLVLAVRSAADMQRTQSEIDRYMAEYFQLAAQKKNIRTLYLLFILAIALFILFVATWIALLLSRQIISPISALLVAAREVRKGNLGHRVRAKAIDELATLVRAFNEMMQELEANSRELESRRRFTETILESIPTGVLSVTADGRIQRVNRALQGLLPPERVERAAHLSDLFSRDDAAEIQYLMKRARRTGIAASQIEVHTPTQVLHLAITVSALPTQPPASEGFVVVLEDTSELLRAQKAAAWHEVARRIAHELKNPLTPIALSAERIGRILDRMGRGGDRGILTPDSQRVLRECARTISREVESVKTLADEFSQFSRFPAAQPVPSDINQIVKNALAVFHGRLDGIDLRVELASGLPLVQVDPEQFKRVVVNLVDNAAEAMRDAPVKHMLLRTLPAAPDSIELLVADTGCGISPEDKEKLFLPYFSTKGRGTGLGLAIVSHILLEHGARVRVEDNRPAGARFYVDIPATVAAEAEARVKTTRVLIVDDEPGIRESLTGVLEDEGYSCIAVESGEKCLQELGRNSYEVVLLDVWLEGMDGLETLARIQEIPFADRPEVVIISGHGTIETAVKATKLGAFDFLEKPLTIEKVTVVLNNAVQQRRLELELSRLKESGDAKLRIIGNSVPMKALRQQLGLMAATNGRVLIFGESGTGKELIAHAIHAASPRAPEAFVEVNCAAIPEELIESELFGHRKGSLAGALDDKIGKLQKADGGTLFLDEVGDMSLKTQAKLLRSLDEQRFEPVGASESIQVDVRVVASTNKNLEEEIERGNFREDLFYRLNVVPFHVPPLRERIEDVRLLADHFLREFTTAYGRKPKQLTEDAFRALEEYPWPGNVRELRNLMERIVIMNPQTGIDARHIPLDRSRRAVFDRPMERFGSLHDVREAAERDYILKKLEEAKGNVTRTAELLGLERSHLYRKMKALGIAPKE